MNKQTVYSLCYTVIFLLTILSGFLGWTTWSVILHPLGYLLLLLYLQQSTGLKGRFHQRLFLAGVLAFLADTFFLYAGERTGLFLIALLTFLSTHLALISAFYLDFKSAQELDKKRAKVAIISSALVFTAFYLQIRPLVGEYKLPVIGYIFLASWLLMMAIFRNQRVNSLSFRLILAGVIIGVAADSAVLYLHFTALLSGSVTWIAALYMVAQFLIFSGGVSRKLTHQQTEV